MSIVNDNAKELVEVAKSIAITILGGEVGADYSDWAEDIAQDVLVELLEAEAEGKIESKYHAFAQVQLATKHRSISFQKGEARRREIEREHGASINRRLTGQSAEALAADPLDTLIAEAIPARLSELSPLLLATLRLHHIDGLPVSAIAEMQGKSEVAIYKRLEAAKAFLEDKQPEETRTESNRPSMEDIQLQQRDNFKRGDTGYAKRKIRRDNPGLSLDEWEAMYGS